LQGGEMMFRKKKMPMPVTIGEQIKRLRSLVLDLAGAVKQQQNQINALRAQVAVLREKVSTLEEGIGDDEDD
jgi:cell division protein FtsB